MPESRWRAVWASWELGLRLARLRREESAALEQAGKSFRPDLQRAPLAEPVVAALARVVALEDRRRGLAGRLAASLAADRHDYRTACSTPGRWLIVARGILDRLVVRDDAWRARRELPRAYAELGARLATRTGMDALGVDERARVAAVRDALQRSAAARRALLAPFGGDALPPALRVVRVELGSLGTFVRAELAKRVFLRLPALAAMAAAWWVTRRYTSSSLEASWNRLTGEGRTGLSPDTLAVLSFGLPLLAAALVAYLCATLARHVRRRYLRNDRGDERAG